MRRQNSPFPLSSGNGTQRARHRSAGLVRTLVGTLALGAAVLGSSSLGGPAEPVQATEASGPRDAEKDRAAATHYQEHVKPVLKARCYACHGALATEGGLRLDTGEAIRAGGDSGPAIVPGKPAESLLWERITSDDDGYRMPPEGAALSAAEQQALRQWIVENAVSPADEVPADDPTQHWAFVPPRATAPPDLPAVSHPIDAWLTATRLDQHVTPVGPANKTLLLRRVYLDLVGLPPTYQQQQEFLADTSPGAYARMVDQLLASPQYGERWARHWMDVWRYSDWYGLGDQLRYSQKHIWHWRDWIIESLNEDTGYDRMLGDMLAADELAPTDADRLRATGFLARNYYLFNRTTWLDSTIEHTAQAFLGLTMNCCKCHDHKYDPLTQEDYYSWRAIFEPHQVRLDSVPGQTDLEKDGIPRVFDAHPTAITYLHRKGNEKDPDTSRPLQPRAPTVFGHIPFAPVPRELPVAAHWPAARPFVLEDHLKPVRQRMESARTELASLDEQLETRQAVADAATSLEQVSRETLGLARHLAARKLAAAEAHGKLLEAAFAADRAQRMPGVAPEPLIADAARAARAHELARAELQLAQAEYDQQAQPDAERQPAEIDKLREKLAAARQAVDNPGTAYPSLYASHKAAEGPDETEASRRQPYPRATTGRRAALARWLVHPDHPLTARVAVNHVWLRHMGQPLVEPVNDFGLRTPPPRQQALLDWLAVSWQRNDWSLKWLHRLIVTSQTYQLSATVPAAAQQNWQHDPENSLYWYRQPIRMESQMIRDSVLHLAGTLDLSLGGPSLPANRDQPPYRRSLYFLHSRDDQHAFLTMFDDADILRCYRRSESVVPQQALAMANSRLTLEMSLPIEKRIADLSRGFPTPSPSGSAPQQVALEPSCAAEADGEDDVFITRAFLTILARRPSVDEMEACRTALDAWQTTLGEQHDATPSAEARRHLVHALLNHNDFITIR